MLYLEDYLEMIEHLPQELRDRFTEMREMDLSVQNSMDSLEKRVKIFFGNAKRLKPAEKDLEHESIRKEYYKTLEDADEKVHLANQMYELVHRYLRRLDAELFKFKIELEADNSGITELLEKRSLELDQPQLNSVSREKENRFSISSRASNAHGDGCADRETTRYIKKEKRRDSNASSTGAEKRQALEKCPGGGPVAVAVTVPVQLPVTVPVAVPVTATVPVPVQAPLATALAADTRPSSVGTVAGSAGGGGGGTTGAAAAAALTQQMQPMSGATSPGVAYSLGHIGAGGNAIAAAASQAIAATQQMQQGRRTASLKASYEAINTGVHAHEFSIGRELAGAAQTALAAIQETTKKHKKSHHRKCGSSGAGGSTSSSVSTSAAASAATSALTTLLAPNSPAAHLDETSLPGATDDDGLLDPTGDGDGDGDADWTYDPNEPRYCICNQVSYGDMVACDNQDCPLEWFHYPCVGISAPPKGKWYCPQCSSAMRRRGSRKN